MPNHITNIVKFIGPREDVISLFNLMKSSETIFDFNKILPMPEELNNTKSPPYPPRKQDDESIEAFSQRQKDWQENQNYLRKTYGAVDWYEWSINNWGTKWNAYDISLTEDKNTIKFDTAWSTPLPMLKALSAKFPSICIDLKYADEDMGYNCGHLTITLGIEQKEWFPSGKGGGSQSIKFACEVKGINYEEYLKMMEE